MTLALQESWINLMCTSFREVECTREQKEDSNQLTSVKHGPYTQTQIEIKVILWQFNYKMHFMVVWTLPLGLP